MLLPKVVRFTIKPGDAFYTAIYERVYTMSVEAQSETKAVVTVGYYDLTPSGYVDGNSKDTLLASEELTIPKSGTAKKWLAKLIIKHDTELNIRTGCERLNASRAFIRRELGLMVK